MPRRRSTTAARPPAGAGAAAVKRQSSPDRTAIVQETAPAKRMRRATRQTEQMQENTTTEEPDSIQAQQSGLVIDDGELSQPDSEDSDLDIGMDDQESQSQSRPKKAAKVYKQRGPRGKYKPREGKLWGGQFINRRPSMVEEGSKAVSARNESVEAETPEDQENFQRSASETPSLSSPKSKDREWYPDPPMMEYPYLQHPFPYHEYEPPPNRVDTSDFGGTPQPLSDDWYRPQGSVAGEDLFTQEKLHYSLSMAKKIEVESDNLRMDIYFQRGFELATRRMLDRIRAKNRLEEIRDEVQQAAGHEYRRSAPIKDPPRVYNEPRLKGGLQENDGQRASLSDDEDMESSSTPTPNPSAINEASENNEELIPTSTVSEAAASASAADESGAETVVPEKDDREKRMDAGTTPTLTDYYQVNAFMTSLFIPGEAQSTSETPLSPAACRILQTLLLSLETKMIGMGCHAQRQELTRRLALIDTLQAGTGTLGDAPAPWRRTQRQPSTPAENADTDTAMALLSAGRTGDEDHYVSPYRRLVKYDMDDFVLNVQPGRPKRGRRKRQGAESTTSFDAGPSTAAGAEAQPSVVIEDSLFRRPFISNPLEIPPAMEPFWKARDYMERQALEERIRAAAAEAQRRQPVRNVQNLV
ncbi:hypothetical protein BGZ68_008135 [Mortierella alpina]|nr:hypothetical protein BGZ68_008135 [Mortierella alpina]